MDCDISVYPFDELFLLFIAVLLSHLELQLVLLTSCIFLAGGMGLQKI
jgi:hypothetical protein